MAEHTPGPWSVWMTGEQLMVTADAKHYPEIAYVGPDTSAGENAFSDEEEANARLIAAAPELLAALKEVVAIADRKTIVFDRARSAIAKAEGR